jgi:hypothetical protein
VTLVDVDALARLVRADLESAEGRDALADAAWQALAHVGAPTRPGGTASVLLARLLTREPLCEDTDYGAPLGSFRDSSIVRGTFGELWTARLDDRSWAASVVASALLPRVLALGDGELATARDDAERRDAAITAIERAVPPACNDLSLRELLGHRLSTAG